MANTTNIREGMQVYGAGDQLLGTIENVEDDGFDVADYHYSRDMVARVAQNRVYVRGTGTARAAVADTTQGEELRVPVVEERLAVGKREVELGEVAIHKTVTEEQQTVPVTLRHEEVRVQERSVAERPATGDNVFKEETIRVALRGEEAVVATEAVVTGEVVVNRETIAEERQIADTVRRQHVDVGQVDMEQTEAIVRTRDTESR
jgi:uncharacterized protein (TIGR02271 family)